MPIAAVSIYRLIPILKRHKKNAKLTRNDLREYKLYCNADSICYYSLCQKDSMDCISTQLSRMIGIMIGDTIIENVNAIRDSIENIYFNLYGEVLGKTGVRIPYYHMFLASVAKKYELTATHICHDKIKENIDGGGAIILAIGINTLSNDRTLHLVQITGYNDKTNTFSVSDPRFHTQNAYRIEDLTNTKFIEEVTLYSLKRYLK